MAYQTYELSKQQKHLRIFFGKDSLKKLLFFALLYGAIPTSYSLATEAESSRQNWGLSEVKKTKSYGSDRVLAYSILKIIKSYYVDSDRIDNSYLLEQLCSGLKNEIHSDCELKNNGLRISILDKNLLRSVQAVPSDEAMIDTFLEAAALFDATAKARNLNSLVVDSQNRSGLEIVFNGLLMGLDAHSALLSAQAFKELKQGTDGAFGGLGILVGVKDHLLKVIKPLPHSPAKMAGIKNNDQILAIDNHHTFGKTLDDLVEFMRGEPGTNVQLKLSNTNSPFPQDLTLTREIIQVDSTEIKKISDNDLNALHLFVESFSSKTSREIYSAIINYKKNHNGKMDGLILDLRGNPGGLLDQAVQVADLFIDEGTIVSTKGRTEEIESAGKGYDDLNFPIIVLMSGDSASASEIVAGALQDHDRALIIGQPSFGKGSVQTIFELPEERAIKLTIARYYTPLGRSIQGKGITPDIWLAPLFKGAKNKNLLGQNHYKNESALRNHLQGIETTSVNFHKELFKGYYLKNKEIDENGGDLVEKKDSDHETNLAVKILKKLKNKYNGQLNVAATKSHHWAALARDDINAYLKNLDNTLTTWLSKNHKINWGEGKDNLNLIPLKMSLKFEKKEIVAEQGQNVQVVVNIKNENSERLNRVSLFIAANNPMFPACEQLLGQVNPKTEMTAKIPLEIPKEWPVGLINFKVYAAIDSVPQLEEVSSFNVNVIKKDFPEIKVITSVVEDVSSKVPNSIESGENAQIRINLENKGATNVEKITIKVVNLSGNQASLIGRQVITVPVIAKGDSLAVSFPFRAATKLRSKEVEFGVVISSSNLKSDLTENVLFKTEVEDVQLLSH